MVNAAIGAVSVRAVNFAMKISESMLKTRQEEKQRGDESVHQQYFKRAQLCGVQKRSTPDVAAMTAPCDRPM